MTRLRLDSSGYFYEGDQRFIPVGVNYWPASSGSEMWSMWNQDEVRSDLDLVKSLGLNAIRFFLRWQDFEPEAAVYDEKQFDRLDTFLRLCGERGIRAQPSMFIGWMSAAVYEPAWKAGRNLYSDAYMIQRGVAYAAKVAKVVSRHANDVLGIDLGNEMDCLPDTHGARPKEIFDWCDRVTRAIRSEYPDCLIVSGLDQAHFTRDRHWRIGEQPGCDYYSVHGYPVPAWNVMRFDGMTDPLAQTLLPHAVAAARSWGPVMMQEFGTILSSVPSHPDRYLRGMLPAAWDAGANGFLYWCLHDIDAQHYPYARCVFETVLGLVGADRKVKPGLEYFIEFAKSLKDRATPVTPPDAVGIYWPLQYYGSHNPNNPGNAPEAMTRRMIVARYLLRQLGRSTRIVREYQNVPSDVSVLLVTGTALTRPEFPSLKQFAERGGHLIIHAPAMISWGRELADIVGADLADYRLHRPSQFTLGGRSWTMSKFLDNVGIELVPRAGTTVLATDDRGLPAVLSHRLGKGVVFTATADVEETFAQMLEAGASAEELATWYRVPLDHIGVQLEPAIRGHGLEAIHGLQQA